MAFYDYWEPLIYTIGQTKQNVCTSGLHIRNVIPNKLL